MGLRISVFDSAELQATLLALKGFDKELKKEIRQRTKAIGLPEWKAALAQNSMTLQENRVLVDTARMTVSDQNVTLQSGALAKKLSGGAKASEVSHHVEFGADRNFSRGVQSSTGKTYKRHTRRQFRNRNLKGYVVYPAAAGFIPRMASLWVQTTVRTFMETMEGGK